MENEELFADAKKKIGTLKVGKTFEAKELFDGIKWNELEKGRKISFGVYFSNKVKDGKLPMVKRSGESKSHHNKYVKI